MDILFRCDHVGERKHEELPYPFTLPYRSNQGLYINTAKKLIASRGILGKRWHEYTEEKPLIRVRYKLVPRGVEH